MPRPNPRQPINRAEGHAKVKGKIGWLPAGFTLPPHPNVTEKHTCRELAVPRAKGPCDVLDSTFLFSVVRKRLGTAPSCVGTCERGATAVGPSPLGSALDKCTWLGFGWVSSSHTEAGLAHDTAWQLLGELGGLGLANNEPLESTFLQGEHRKRRPGMG